MLTAKEKKAAYQKRWHAANPNYHREWAKKNPDKTNEKRYKWVYGITLEQYNVMFETQRGCCAICEKHQANFKRKLSVDHNHSTGKVRGLLCDLCNRALGYLKDSPTIVSKAAEYLRNHGSI